MIKNLIRSFLNAQGYDIIKNPCPKFCEKKKTATNEVCVKHPLENFFYPYRTKKILLFILC